MCLVLVRKLGPALDAEVLYEDKAGTVSPVPPPRHLLLNKGEEEAEVEEVSAVGLFPTPVHANSGQARGRILIP